MSARYLLNGWPVIILERYPDGTVLVAHFAGNKSVVSWSDLVRQEV